MSSEAAEANRRQAPVFVVGSPRSGTTLLYHMLLSAGGFAVYRSETNAFNILETHFGPLASVENRRRLMDSWLRSKLFRVSGLDAEQIRARVLEPGCRNGGDFLRIVMGEVARRQNVERWADCTPEHALYVSRIKETIPDALVIHIIRDGRDVALSMSRLAFPRTLPWDRERRLVVAGLYWGWMVRHARRSGRTLGRDYLEVRFEELVSHPRETLLSLSRFIGQDLDYDRILEVGIGSVSDPNSSFKAGGRGGGFQPVGRWREALDPAGLQALEDCVGGLLEALGYEPANPGEARSRRPRPLVMRAVYRMFFGSKLCLKRYTPLARLCGSKDIDRVMGPELR